MQRLRPQPLAAAVLGLLAGAWTCAAQEADPSGMQATIEALRAQNESLEKSLVQANKAEKEASEQLARVRLRLEALGRDLLDGGNDRLVEANANLEILGRRVSNLEGTSTRLVSAVSDYLGKALAADPESRLRVETAIRELDEVIGLRQKPAPARAGSAGQAKVVNIDPVSGLLVLNIGEEQNTRIGTTYHLVRGEQTFGSAIVADVRRNVCGAFVEEIDAGQGPVRLGDTAILITE
ncbi:hypothetical protein [Luteolibacter marinus]|uniref:hypothetical protein n=1 Tax=Luteolibacter marinus TaxID=2776705 RepID=UPI0018665034|nr:hypothetical protein [Luteolibacter marinus]